MSNMLLDKNDFGLKLYNRFPPKYRQDDAMVNHSLKRYLQSLGDGGFRYAIEDVNGLLDLQNPETAPSKVLPLLFEQYGLELFNGIPETYLRYLLPKLSEAWKKKGNISVIEFIVSSLGGVKTETELTYDEGGFPFINVRLEMDYNLGSYFPDPEQFNRILEEFIPFYCDYLLIYSYLFHDVQKIVGKEALCFDEIRYTTDEYAFIPYTRDLRLKSNTNILTSGLNNTFILNEGKYFDIDPDSFADLVQDSFSDSVGINRSQSLEHCVLTLNNVDRNLNSNFILNTFMETDHFIDRIHDKVFSDTSGFRSKEDTGISISMFSGTEKHNIRYTEREEAARVSTLSSEKQAVKTDKSYEFTMGVFLNEDHSVLNEGILSIPTCFDEITYRNGKKVLCIPTPNAYVGV